MTGLDDFDLDILFAAHRNALLAALDRRPATFEARILCASVEALDIEVVNVDERMRHAPGDVGRVNVVREIPARPAPSDRQCRTHHMQDASAHTCWAFPEHGVGLPRATDGRLRCGRGREPSY